MKILFLSYKFHPDIGGIEVNSEILANFFSKEGAEIHLVTCSEEKSPKTFPFKIIQNPNRLKLIKEHLWADVVFENNPSLKLSWPLWFLPKPHIIAIHTWINRLDGSLGIQDKLKLNWLKRADAVISVSKTLRDGTFAKAIVIENSYNNSLFKRLYNVEKDRDFIFLGRLVSDKGGDMAIELIKRLHQFNDFNVNPKKYNLTIVGDGSERRRLENMVKEFKLTAYVHFAGVLTGENLVKCLNQHRYMLVPSRWQEPFGIVALEGMASGCLPFVSDGGGLPDAVGNAGVVFQRNNIESLYKKVQDLLGNPILESSLRNNFANHLKVHSSEVISKQYFELIKNSLPHNGRN